MVREKAEENERKEAEGMSGLHKQLWSYVSVEGTNGWRGLPNKRRHLQQLSQLTGKQWRFANVGWQQGNLNNEACGRKERGMRRWRGVEGGLRKKDVVLMKQVPGSPSPLNAGIIQRLSACFSSAEPLEVRWGDGGGGWTCVFSSQLQATLTMQITTECLQSWLNDSM